jgi:hypothetical protein
MANEKTSKSVAVIGNAVGGRILMMRCLACGNRWTQ